MSLSPAKASLHNVCLEFVVQIQISVRLVVKVSFQSYFFKRNERKPPSEYLR